MDETKFFGFIRIELEERDLLCRWIKCDLCPIAKKCLSPISKSPKAINLLIISEYQEYEKRINRENHE
jgi:hypothetical protein